jgi:hypothetical protein
VSTAGGARSARGLWAGATASPRPVSHAAKTEPTVGILDDDVAEDGSVLPLMDLLDGEALDARRERSARKLGVADVVTRVRDLHDMLAAAHAKRIGARRRRRFKCKPATLFALLHSPPRLLRNGVAPRLFSGRVASPAAVALRRQQVVRRDSERSCDPSERVEREILPRLDAPHIARCRAEEPRELLLRHSPRLA